MSNDASQVTVAPEKPKKVFTLGKLWLMAMGTFVGSGVVSILGFAAGVTGYSVWLSYLIACIVGFGAALPFFMMSSVMYFNGGTYTIATTFLGKRFGGAYIVSTFTSGIAIAMMAAAFGTYVASVFPGQNITLWAVGILTLFYVVNLLGIDFLAVVQKYSTLVLLIALGVFCVIAYMRLDAKTFAFADPQFMTSGVTGLMTAAAMLFFSTYSYDGNVYVMSKYTRRPLTNMPKAIFLTFLGLVAVYCGVAVAAVGGAGLDAFANKPLTPVAFAIMPRALAYAFIVLGPVMCLTTTINGVFAGFTIAFEKATLDGWFARSFASRNKRGAPWKILTTIYVVCVVPLIFSINISILTSTTVFLSSILFVPLLIAVIKLPKMFPEAFAKNTLGISPTVYRIGVVISWFCRGLIIYYSLKNLSVTNSVGSIIAVILCFVYAYFRDKSGKTNVVDSYNFDNDD